MLVIDERWYERCTHGFAVLGEVSTCRSSGGCVITGVGVRVCFVCCLFFDCGFTKRFTAERHRRWCEATVFMRQISAAAATGRRSNHMDGAQPASIDRLLRVPGVRAVLGMETTNATPVRHAGQAMDGIEEAYRHTQILAPLLSRAQAAASDGLLDADDSLLLFSVRTRLEIEYVMAPESSTSDLAVVCIQGPDWTPPVREIRYQPLEADCDWLFGAADE